MAIAFISEENAAVKEFTRQIAFHMGAERNRRETQEANNNLRLSSYNSQHCLDASRYKTAGESQVPHTQPMFGKLNLCAHSHLKAFHLLF